MKYLDLSRGTIQKPAFVTRTREAAVVALTANIPINQTTTNKKISYLYPSNIINRFIPNPSSKESREGGTNWGHWEELSLNLNDCLHYCLLDLYDSFKSVEVAAALKLTKAAVWEVDVSRHRMNKKALKYDNDLKYSGNDPRRPGSARPNGQSH